MMRKLIMFAVAMLIAGGASAVQIRVATYNVEYGFDGPGSPEWVAITSMLTRVGADIVGMNELTTTKYDNFIMMAAYLGYPYTAFSTNYNAMTGASRLGYMSKFPITSAAAIPQYPGALELYRPPFRCVFDVPGALNNFVAYEVHYKASQTDPDEFSRAIEVRRTRSNIVQYITSNPLDTEFVVMGDMNDDIDEYPGQPISFSSVPAGMHASYVLGSDVQFPQAYRVFPDDRFSESIDFMTLHPYREDSTEDGTSWMSDIRWDYMIFSRDVMESPYGAPAGEVYHSAWDDGAGAGGLPKYGTALNNWIISNGPNHCIVFADINLMDLLPCLNPVLIISEIVDSTASTNANYVELYNSGTTALSLTNYQMMIYVDASTSTAYSVSLTGSIAPGGKCIIASHSTTFSSTYGMSATIVNANVNRLNGNDVVAIKNPNGTISDMFGVIGDFTGWAYQDKRAERISGISDPSSDWISGEWTIGTSTPTPGVHSACDEASVYYADIEMTPPAPSTGVSFVVTADIQPNLPASNLSPTVYYRLNSNSWTSIGMTNVSGTIWAAPSIFPGALGDNQLSYYILTTFDGPSAVPAPSVTNIYQYPPAPGSAGDTPRFNEVEVNSAGTDGTNPVEFIEIIAPAGMNMSGYFIVHYNGNETSDGGEWRWNFPTFVVPDDGITDIYNTPLGFVVIGPTNSTVANTDFASITNITSVTGILQGDADGLVLYDAATNPVDAIAWGAGSGDLTSNDPGTIVTTGVTSADNYLHDIPADSANDARTLQAPCDVLNDDGLGWALITATPGALNGRQTNAVITLGTAQGGDDDGDGIGNSVDNCPGTYNPTQSDIDSDGIGNACDDDRDGDGVLNINDNCPDTPNADQTDSDGDGDGDVCDYDNDNDGVDDEYDNCLGTYNPDQADDDSDGIGDACDPDYGQATNLASTFFIYFESPYPPATSYSPEEKSLTSSYPTNWFMNNAVGGSTSNDVKTGVTSLRMRFIDGAATSNGVLQSTAPFAGIYSVGFNYAMYGSDSSGTLSVQTSSNGTSWVAFTNVVANGIQTNFASFFTKLEKTGPTWLRFLMVSGSPLNRLNIDDIAVIPYEPTAVTVSLTNLVHTYNGSPKIPTVVMDVTGLVASVTYNGSTFPPSDAGSYTVVATAPAPCYTGAATGTLIIARGTDTITFSNTNQTYNGSPRTVTAVAGSGSSVALTYDGSATAPTEAGSYAVTGVVDTVNWMGTNTTVLTITSVNLAPVFDTIGTQSAFVDALLTFYVSAVGYPEPTLALQGTTAASGFSFTPASGQLDYTPPAGDAGTQYFTFTASNSEGTATQVVEVTVSAGVPSAPASIWASETNGTDFTAAWSAVAGATSYRLDVDTAGTFSGGGGGGINTNLVAFDFAAYVGSEEPGSSTYAASNMQSPALITRGSGIKAAANAGRFNSTGWDGAADPAAGMAAGNYYEWTIQPMTGYMMSITNISFNLQRSSTGASNVVLRANHDSYNANLATCLNFADNDTTVTVSTNLDTVAGLQNVTTSVTFRLVAWTGANAGAMGFEGTGDDILIQGTIADASGGASTYIPGYSNRTVSATTEVVSGLSPNSTYYFRARTVSPGGTSDYTSVANVTTKTPQNITSFPAIADQVTTSAVGLTATASSGLAVEFAVGSGPATISGGTNLTFTGAGTVSIIASQPGNATYAPAADVTNTLNVTKATAAVSLSNLAQTYDGTARIVTATTTPTGLTVSITYDGSPSAPTNAGSYSVAGTISDAMYQGFASDSLVVSKISATVTLTNLLHTYDGTPKSATATTVPAGLTVDLTYNGSATAPTNEGSYAVTGTVNDVNYSGSATDTMVISAGAADADGDGMIDSWETANFGNTTTAGPGTDYDGDQYLDIYEHGAGTQPTNPASLLKINSGAQIVGGAKVISWSSIAGKEYMLLRSTDLSVPFVGIASNIMATDPENVYTDAAAPVVDRLLYRIQVE